MARAIDWARVDQLKAQGHSERDIVVTYDLQDLMDEHLGHRKKKLRSMGYGTKDEEERMHGAAMRAV